MTGYDEPFSDPAFDDQAFAGQEAADDPVIVLERVSEAQEVLRQDFERLYDGFERLAAAVVPLTTKQYHDTLARVRVLEIRLRNRQERPLIIKMAKLLADVRRLESAGDVKVHVEEELLAALTSVGYQEMGSPGDQFDPGLHEPVSGSTGRAGKVTRVHRRGLTCYGDVIIKAMVDVEPVPADEDAGPPPGAEEGEPAPGTPDLARAAAAADGQPGYVEETEQEGYPI